jgi:hypothetical protein
MFWAHCNDDHDRCQSARNNHKQAKVLYGRNEAIAKYDEHAATPEDDEERGEDVPRLYDEGRMEDSVHLDCSRCRDGGDGGNTEEPAEEVDKTGEESHNPSIARPRRYRGPVIYWRSKSNRLSSRWQVMHTSS